MNSTQDLYENNNPTLFSQACDVGTGKFEPDVHRNKAYSVSGTCDNPLRKNMPTCKDADLDLFIDEVDGLQFDVVLPSVDSNFPSYIPILDKETAQLSYLAVPNGINVLGMTLSDVISKGITYSAGTQHEQDEIEFRLSLLLGNAVRGKKVVLFASGSDTLIEWLWYNRKECELFQNLKAMGFSFATGINFSVIKGECGLGQALNQKKSLISTGMMSQVGIQSVPHIYTIDSYDIDRWVDYLSKNSHIRTVSMNCQLQKRVEDIEAVILGVTQILQKIPHLHIILVGFHLNLMHRFGPLLERIHFADKKPAKFAQSHRKMIIDPDSLKMKDVYSTERVTEILAHNINQRRMYVEIVKKTTLEKYKIPDEIIRLIESNFLYHSFQKYI